MARRNATSRDDAARRMAGKTFLPSGVNLSGLSVARRTALVFIGVILGFRGALRLDAVKIARKEKRSEPVRLVPQGRSSRR